MPTPRPTVGHRLDRLVQTCPLWLVVGVVVFCPAFVLYDREMKRPRFGIGDILGVTLLIAALLSVSLGGGLPHAHPLWILWILGSVGGMCGLALSFLCRNFWWLCFAAHFTIYWAMTLTLIYDLRRLIAALGG